ncbi:unnamed protein product [Polarella glacialis]|uniref:Uncharacterized protein n=1 Tax=Polarella glacialis TaxID=89957 RepID=A0A813DRB4_POLGL|nr:unnamed protein product [Polarella glacialis]CAE8587964.1 unnamed protein product [Polarella glacialis]CAE8628325.1 unnamed protein product [Polarella glacialis]CAE8628326.1 unnamed protein product [Polarella glacialis]CAE8628327.1 unnamed protein product [Polarella glacialis]
MARRSASALLAVALCVAAFWALANVSESFVSAPATTTTSLRGAEAPVRLDQFAQGAALAAVLAAPEAAHAANSGYAVLQLGWAFFIISLGPAVLFWIYFNKPELL